MPEAHEGYQPSEGEISKAEGMMRPDERLGSAHRAQHTTHKNLEGKPHWERTESEKVEVEKAHDEVEFAEIMVNVEKFKNEHPQFKSAIEKLDFSEGGFAKGRLHDLMSSKLYDRDYPKYYLETYPEPIVVSDGLEYGISTGNSIASIESSDERVSGGVHNQDNAELHIFAPEGQSAFYIIRYAPSQSADGFVITELPIYAGNTYIDHDKENEDEQNNG